MLLVGAIVRAAILEGVEVGLVLVTDTGGVYVLPRFEHPLHTLNAVSYTHLTLPTICSV